MRKPEVYYEIHPMSRRCPNGKVVEGYATRLYNRGKIRRVDFTRYMRKVYGIKRDDLKGVLGAVAGAILSLTLDGYNVNVPYIGSFKLYANASTETDRDKAGRRAVKGLHLRIRPSTEMKHYFEKDGCIYLEWPGKKSDKTK